MTKDDWRTALQNDDMPLVVKADDILDLSSEFVYNAAFRYGMTYVIMVNGWYYKAVEDSDSFHLCDALQKLDPVYFHGR